MSYLQSWDWKHFMSSFLVGWFHFCNLEAEGSAERQCHAPLGFLQRRAPVAFCMYMF